jgi:hypothetical protein
LFYHVLFCHILSYRSIARECGLEMVSPRDATIQHQLVPRQRQHLRVAQHSTAQHSTAQHSTARHSTARHGTAQHSTAQHSTAQLCLVVSLVTVTACTVLQVSISNFKDFFDDYRGLFSSMLVKLQ